MKLIKWIKNLFKDEENGIVPDEIEEKCRHDWEIIKKYPFVFSPLNGTYDEEEVDMIYINRMLPHSFLPQKVVDRVCMTCGECHNGFKIMQEHNKKEEERKEYAKQLWENGCK